MNKILVVDDEAAAIDLLRHALDPLEVEIVATTDPGEAVGLVEALQPDLILLDLIMPGIDGLQTLQQLRARVPATIYLPILVVTGHSDAAMRRAALVGGASDLIGKPYDPIEVALRVGTMLQTRALLRQRRQADVEARLMRDEFLSRMSHELRTPLNAILGFGQQLDVPGRTAEEAENIRQILSAGRRLLTLIDGLLDISPDRASGLAEAAAAPGAANADNRLFLVLYIEDNLSNLRLMRRVLAQRPAVALLHASLGQDGVDWAREHRPDLILLDLHLPDISGEHVLEQLRGDPVISGIPVAILTADATAGTRGRLLASGASAFLTKPLDVRQVLSVVDRFTARAHSQANSGEPV